MVISVNPVKRCLSSTWLGSSQVYHKSAQSLFFSPTSARHLKPVCFKCPCPLFSHASFPMWKPWATKSCYFWVVRSRGTVMDSHNSTQLNAHFSARLRDGWWFSLLLHTFTPAALLHSFYWLRHCLHCQTVFKWPLNAPLAVSPEL